MRHSAVLLLIAASSWFCVPTTLAQYNGFVSDDELKALVSEGMLARRSPLENNFMRFGKRGMPRDAQGDFYVRLARALAQGQMERMARGGGSDSNSGYIRFGRNDPQGSNFVRFGKADQGSNFVRFGRSETDSSFDRYVRPEPSNYIRYGRSVPDSSFDRPARPEPSNYVRFGRSGPDSNYVRFGRSPQEAFPGAQDAHAKHSAGAAGNAAFERPDRAYVDEETSTEAENAHQEVTDGSAKRSGSA